MSYKDLTIPLLLDTPIDAEGASKSQTVTRTKDGFLAELTKIDFERVRITQVTQVAQVAQTALSIIDQTSNKKVQPLVNKRVLIRPVKTKNSHLHLKHGVVMGLFGDKNDPRYVRVYVDGLTHMVMKDEVQILDA